MQYESKRIEYKSQTLKTFTRRSSHLQIPMVALSISASITKAI